jgi:hypothetical protein
MRDMDDPDIAEFRPIGKPKPDHRVPRPSMRESRIARLLTFGTLIFAVAWEAGVTLFHLHPSKLTFTGFLAVLIFYTGEFLDWKRPRLPKREPKQHHQWRDR